MTDFDLKALEAAVERVRADMRMSEMSHDPRHAIIVDWTDAETLLAALTLYQTTLAEAGEVIEPVRVFMERAAFLPDSTPLTNGSSLARRQLKAGELKAIASLSTRLNTMGLNHD
jgi:hypothetical protein